MIRKLLNLPEPNLFKRISPVSFLLAAYITSFLCILGYSFYIFSKKVTPNELDVAVFSVILIFILLLCEPFYRKYIGSFQKNMAVGTAALALSFCLVVEILIYSALNNLPLKENVPYFWIWPALSINHNGYKITHFLVSFLPNFVIGVITLMVMAFAFCLLALLIRLTLGFLIRGWLPYFRQHWRRAAFLWLVLAAPFAAMKYAPVSHGYTHVETWPIQNFPGRRTQPVHSILVDSQQQIWAAIGPHLYVRPPGSQLWLAADKGMPTNQDSYANWLKEIDGTLYISIDGYGLYYWLPDENTWEPLNDGLPIARINDIAMLANGDLWAGMENNGTYRFVPSRKLWVRNAEGIPSKTTVQVLIQTHDGRLLAGVNGNGLYWYNDQTNTWSKDPRDPGPECNINSLIESPDHYLWISMFEGDFPFMRLSLDEADSKWEWLYGLPGGTFYGWRGVMRNDSSMLMIFNKPDLIYSFNPQTQRWQMESSLTGWKGNNISAFAEEPGGAIWLGFATGGIERWDPVQGWKVMDEALPQQVYIETIIKKAQGNDVLAATDAGVYQYSDISKQWMPLGNNLTDEDISVLYESRDGLIIAGAKSGVYQYDPETNTWKILSSTFSLYSGSVGESQDGLLWIVDFHSFPRKLFVYDWIKKIDVTDELKLPDSVTVCSFFNSRDGTLWCLDVDSGLYVYHPQNKSWTLSLAKVGIGDTAAEADNGDLLIGISTTEGVLRFTPSTNRVVYYPPDENMTRYFKKNNNNRSDDNIYRVLETPDGIFALTYQGVFLYSEGGWTHLELLNYSKNRLLRTMLLSNTGDLLVSDLWGGAYRMEVDQQTAMLNKMGTFSIRPLTILIDRFGLLKVYSDDESEYVFRQVASTYQWIPVGGTEPVKLADISVGETPIIDLKLNPKHPESIIRFQDRVSDIAYVGIDSESKELWFTYDSVGWNPIGQLDFIPTSISIDLQNRQVKTWTWSSDGKTGQISEFSISFPWYLRSPFVALLIAVLHSPFYEMVLLGLFGSHFLFKFIPWLLAHITLLQAKESLVLQWFSGALGQKKASFTGVFLGGWVTMGLLCMWLWSSVQPDQEQINYVFYDPLFLFVEIANWLNPKPASVILIPKLGILFLILSILGVLFLLVCRASYTFQHSRRWVKLVIIFLLFDLLCLPYLARYAIISQGYKNIETHSVEKDTVFQTVLHDTGASEFSLVMANGTAVLNKANKWKELWVPKGRLPLVTYLFYPNYQAGRLVQWAAQPFQTEITGFPLIHYLLFFAVIGLVSWLGLLVVSYTLGRLATGLFGEFIRYKFRFAGVAAFLVVIGLLGYGLRFAISTTQPNQKDLPTISQAYYWYANTMLIDSDSRKWLALRGAGLFRQDEDHQRYSSENITNYPISLYQDRNGTMWAGTDSFGVYQKKIDDMEWSSANKGLQETFSLITPWVFQEDSRGNLLVGVDQQGVWKWIPDKEAWEEYGANQGDATVITLAEGPDSTLWAGRFPGGAAYLNPGADRWELMNNGLPDNSSVRTLVFDSQGTLWAGLWEAKPVSIYRLPKGASAWEPVSTGLPKDTGTRVLYRDRQGSLLAGQINGGLFQFDPTQKQWSPYESGLPKNADIRSLREDPHGDLWVQTADASHLYHRSPAKSAWEIEDVSIPDCIVMRQMVETENGTLWAVLENPVLDNKGWIYRLEPGSPNWKRINLTDIDDTLFNISNLLATSDGSIWFSTSTKVYQYDQRAKSFAPVMTGLPAQIRIGQLLETENGDMIMTYSPQYYEAPPHGQLLYRYSAAKKAWSIVTLDKLKEPSFSLSPDFQLAELVNTQRCTITKNSKGLVFCGLTESDTELPVLMLEDDNSVTLYSEGLPESHASYLVATHDDTLWVLVNSFTLGENNMTEIYQRRPNSQRWEPAPAETAAGAKIIRIWEGRSGELWGESDEKEYYRLSKNTNSWEPIQWIEQNQQKISQVYWLNNGDILGTSNTCGVFRLEQEGDQVEWQTTPVPGWSPKWISGSPTGHFWAGYGQNTTYIFEINQGQIKNMEIETSNYWQHLMNESSTQMGLPDSAIYIERNIDGSYTPFSKLRYAEGALWYSSDSLFWNPIAQLYRMPIGGLSKDSGNEVTFWTNMDDGRLEEYQVHVPIYYQNQQLNALLALGKTPQYWILLGVSTLALTVYLLLFYLFNGWLNKIPPPVFVKLNWAQPDFVNQILTRQEGGYRTFRTRLKDLDLLAHMLIIYLNPDRSWEISEIQKVMLENGVVTEAEDVVRALSLLHRQGYILRDNLSYQFSNPMLAHIYQSSMPRSSRQSMVENMRLLNSVFTDVQSFFDECGFAVLHTDGNFLLLAPYYYEHIQQVGDKIPCTVLGDQVPRAGDIERAAHTARTYQNGIAWKVAFLVINQSPDQTALAQMYLYRVEDNFIIVPIYRVRMKSALANHVCLQEINNVLKDYLCNDIDLYNRSIPVRDVDFYGRVKPIEALRTSLDQGQHIGIFALNKMGKTSLIQHLSERLDDQFVTVVDLQSETNNTSFLYRSVMQKLLTDIHSKKPFLSLPKMELLEQEIHELPDVVFVKDLTNLYNTIQQQNVKARFVIFVDEIDRMLPYEGTEYKGFLGYGNFLATFRGLSQLGLPLTLVVAGLRADINRLAKIEGLENAAFQMFKELFLPPLEITECEDMIVNIGKQMGISYSKEVIQRIYDESGGHPFLARLLCSLIWNSLRQCNPNHQSLMVGIQHVNEAVEIFIDDGSRASNLEQIWSSRLSEEEQAVVSRLAAAEEPQERKEGERKAMNNLVQRHIVVHHGERYTIRFGLFRRWVRAFILNID